MEVLEFIKCFKEIPWMRVLSWVIVAAVCYGVYKLIKNGFK